MSPLISVVMPVYNGENFLKKSVNSVLSQSYTNWELHIIDDHSDDNSYMLALNIADVDPRIQVRKAWRKFGCPAGPRNLGVKIANGDLVAFLDVDDLWHPQKLELQLNIMSENNIPFCSTGMINFSKDEQVEFDNINKINIKKISFFSQIIKFQTPTSSVLCDKKLLLRHPFIEDKRYKAREDLECWLQCLSEIKESIKIINNLTYYRVSTNQISKSKSRMIIKHFFVLKNLRIKADNKKMGLGQALFFTMTHFTISFFLRLILRRL